MKGPTLCQNDTRKSLCWVGVENASLRVPALYPPLTVYTNLVFSFVSLKARLFHLLWTCFGRLCTACDEVKFPLGDLVVVGGWGGNMERNKLEVKVQELEKVFSQGLSGQINSNQVAVQKTKLYF